MYNQLKLIKELCALGERQLRSEIKASKLLMAELASYKVKFKVQNFATKIPLVKSAKLAADKREIKVKGTSFVSGVIKNKFNLIIPAIGCKKINQANINYNPYCQAISQSDFFFTPSLAISKRDVGKIKRARYVEGRINVLAQKHHSLNILVGNLKSPKNIIFAHYDSIGPGAVDDAAGIAVLTRLIIDFPMLEKENLFVLAGNEELSYDTPYYWGKGYRVFEKKYSRLLKNAKKIIIADSVGASAPLVSKKLSLIRPCFPIKNMKKYLRKSRVIYSDLKILNKFYHSDLDTIVNVKKNYLNQTARKILKLIGD